MFRGVTKHYHMIMHTLIHDIRFQSPRWRQVLGVMYSTITHYYYHLY